MITTTEIYDRDRRGALAVSFDKLLDLLRPKVVNKSWRILELEAVGNKSVDLAKLNYRIELDPYGLAMSHDDIMRLAIALEQVINAVIVVPCDNADLPSVPVDAMFYEKCELALECIDACTWRVTSRRNEVHDMLHASFCETSRVSQSNE